MKTSIHSLFIAIGGVAVALFGALASAHPVIPLEDGCEGCEDTSEAPSTPDPITIYRNDEPTSFVEGVITPVVALGTFDGECWSPFPEYDPRFGTCTQSFPCTPYIKIEAVVVSNDEDPYKWKSAGSGTVCNRGHNPAIVEGLTGGADPLTITVTLFDDPLPVPCGTVCSIDASYAIELWTNEAFIGQIGSGSFDVSGSLSCAACNFLPG